MMRTRKLITLSRTVPAIGSNKLELQAALFGLQQAEQRFSGRQFALFTDNTDAAIRLTRAKEKGPAQDPGLATMLPGLDIARVLTWLKGHSNCRGNTLADEVAREAAR